jgi:ATP-dependent Clp protease protease subunit
MDPQTDKSPCEIIDEESTKNSPVKETVEILKAEEERDKKEKEKKEKKEKESQRSSKIDDCTPEEKLRDDYRCKIDLMTYEHRYKHLEKHLEEEQKRSEIKLESEINDLVFQQKRRKVTQQSELLQSQLDLRTKQDKWKLIVDRKPEYLTNPVQVNPLNGEIELVVSDRIIELSGVITYATSEYVTNLIHYYNNSSQSYPIFLIIDYSPGGSVMSGYRILKTMEASPAPVYVVVKSYAASMAAMIASIAQHSFIYPNAIMLHHQILTRTSGNLRQHQEQVKDLEEWYRRLAGPFTDKLKIKLQDFVDQMYQNNSDGDWREFGDRAVELGWINTLVNRIRMTGNLEKKPTSNDDDHDCHQDKNNKNKRKHQDDHDSPPKKSFELRPLDHWWIHDPDNYYNL